jgi:hypothetical protein
VVWQCQTVMVLVSSASGRAARERRPPRFRTPYFTSINCDFKQHIQNGFNVIPVTIFQYIALRYWQYTKSGRVWLYKIIPSAVTRVTCEF